MALYLMDLGLAKTFHLQTRVFIPMLIPLLFNGCTKAESIKPAAAPMPEITTAYLFEHRIISHEPKYQEKIIATLPYEIESFDEEYLLCLIARIPDEKRSAVFAATKPRYYLWLERTAVSWRDFTEVHSPKIAPLQIDPHFSAIRKGLFYKEYSIDFTLEQLESVQDSGLDLLLINQKNETSEINLPSRYIKAFLKMLENRTDS